MNNLKRYLQEIKKLQMNLNKSFVKFKIINMIFIKKIKI